MRGTAVLVAGLAALAAGLWLLPDPALHGDPAPAPPAPVLAGADVSWPSCRHQAANPLPVPAAFGIVGVNDGVPNTRNPCLAQQVAWAAQATGGSRAGRVGYYAIAADPFSPRESRWARPEWPRDAVWRGRVLAVPAVWGACTGSGRAHGCAWVFGFETAWRDAHLPGVARAADATWWLDVETAADWSSDRRFDEALIEGMVAGFRAPPAEGGVGARAGLYSNAGFWSTIVGEVRDGSPLPALPEWLPIGEGSREDAAAALAAPQPFLAGAPVEIVQHVEAGVDRDVASARR